MNFLKSRADKEAARPRLWFQTFCSMSVQHDEPQTFGEHQAVTRHLMHQEQSWADLWGQLSPLQAACILPTASAQGGSGRLPRRREHCLPSPLECKSAHWSHFSP